MEFCEGKRLITKEVAEFAAKWWADRVCCKDVKFDNGDKSVNGVVVQCLASSLVKPASDKEKENFIIALTEGILDKQRDTLAVDYHPDDILRNAAHQSGISEHNFPWKTVMFILPDDESTGFKILVKEGYGAPQQQVYPVQKEE